MLKFDIEPTKENIEFFKKWHDEKFDIYKEFLKTRLCEEINLTDGAYDTMCRIIDEVFKGE